MSNPISRLRLIALLEGVSFLLLVGIAMPMKYLWQLPMAVKVAGMIHGVLFLLLCGALLLAMRAGRWPLSRGALIFVASLLPFGPLLVDGRMRTYEADYMKSRQ